MEWRIEVVNKFVFLIFENGAKVSISVFNAVGIMGLVGLLLGENIYILRSGWEHNRKK